MSSFSKEASKQFFKAAKNGNISLVQALSHDPQVNLNWKNNGTPFYWACRNDHPDVVQYLLKFSERPIDYNLLHLPGTTPFSEACSKGCVEVVKMLVSDERIDLNKVDSYGSTPLWRAAFDGKPKVVKLLLASGRQIDTTKRDEGHYKRTAAEIARLRENFEIASLIVKFERDPSTTRAQLRRELNFQERSFERKLGVLLSVASTLPDNELNDIDTFSLTDNMLKAVPQKLTEMVKLTSLTLKWNSIDSLPTFVGDFVFLTTLNLSDNNLTSLPSEIV